MLQVNILLQPYYVLELGFGGSKTYFYFETENQKMILEWKMGHHGSAEILEVDYKLMILILL